jgi:anti-sigma regulatory factor (Ser/Thr protein kinase)
MIELSLHILDIAENSVRAGAKIVQIMVAEDTQKDSLTIQVRDDGRGMCPEEMERALDPFYTTKKVRRVGLGLPMLKEAAERTGGNFSIESEPGRGTTVSVDFGLSHVDRQPLGDVGLSIMTLITGNQGVEFIYSHRRDGREYQIDTREIKKELGDVPIQQVEVLSLIRNDITEGIKDLGASA